MADFEIAFDETMIQEGGYVNDPDDRGGETYRGVARAFHGDWPGWKIVDQIKSDFPNDFKDHLDQSEAMDQLVRDFYRAKFWNVIQGDEISDQALANELFDTGVHQGTSSVVKYWQEALNLLNRNERDYPNIEIDGKAGVQTLETTEKFYRRNPNSTALVKILNIMQGHRYLELARKTPSQKKFMHGWLKRVNLCP
ncbi:MAG: glycosyl hydrolase 108 family protein [Pirellulaceae bacterium]